MMGTHWRSMWRSVLWKESEMWGTPSTSQKHILYLYIIYTHVQIKCASSAVSSLQCEWMPSGIKKLVDWTECQPSMIKNTIYNWRAITLIHCWINAVNMKNSFTGSGCWSDDVESITDWLHTHSRNIGRIYCRGMLDFRKVWLGKWGVGWRFHDWLWSLS